MAVSVRISGLDKLEALYKKLSRPEEVMEIISKDLAEETIALMREGFSEERDPYGQPWEPLKARVGRILQDTGALRNSWRRKSVGKAGFVVGPSVPYAAFHQLGTRYIPVRPMVPNDGNLPERWGKRYQNIVSKRLKEHLGGR